MKPFEVCTESSNYYYTYNGPLTLSLECTLMLDHDIDADVLQAALTRAARTYPQFSSRLAYVDGRFWYVENELPVRLYTKWEDSFSLGGADTNYYPYRVWAEGAKLGIVANHGLGDGRCLGQFLTTLLYYYAVERGLIGEDEAIEGVTREGDASIPAFDPIMRYANMEAAPMGTPDIGPIFAPPVEYSEDKGDFTCYVDTITVSAAQLRELSKRVASRVSPLVMALEARAAARTWDASGKALIGPITNDLRPYFDSAGVGNFSSWVLAVLPAQVMQADLATQCAVLQQAMEAQLGIEAMRNQMARKVKEVDAKRGKSLDELFGATEECQQGIRYTRQYLGLYVSNVGNLRMPEPLSSMVVGAECILPSFTSPFNLTMVGVGDDVRLSITRTFDDDAFTHAMVSELADNGVEAKLEQRPRRSFPTTNRDAVLELEAL